jgi:hypothetical protein
MTESKNRTEQDTMDAACERAHKYAMGRQEPHGFEYGPGGSPYCKVCGCSAEGFYHRIPSPWFGFSLPARRQS